MLAASIKHRGLQHPIEILSDGQVIAGRKRRLALLSLGRKSANVRVRYDLEEKGETAVLMHVLGDNLERRNMKPLEVARTYLLYKKLLEGKEAVTAGDKRDQLAEKFGVSGRTLDRYARVLTTPRPVQDAFDAGEISLQVATKIAGLTADERNAIGDAFTAGEDPQVVVARYLQRQPSKLQKEQRGSDVAAVLSELVKHAATLAKSSVPLTERHQALVRGIVTTLTPICGSEQPDA